MPYLQIVITWGTKGTGYSSANNRIPVFFLFLIIRSHLVIQFICCLYVFYEWGGGEFVSYFILNRFNLFYLSVNYTVWWFSERSINQHIVLEPNFFKEHRDPNVAGRTNILLSLSKQSLLEFFDKIENLVQF